MLGLGEKTPASVDSGSKLPMDSDTDAIEPAPTSSIATSMEVPAAPHRHASAAGANHISLDDVAPVSVEVRDLAVAVDTSPSVLEPDTYGQLFRERFRRPAAAAASDDEARPPTAHVKTLLRGVSMSVAPGTLTAIIGGSGSGKTTLLNTLAERVASPRLSRAGEAAFNGAASVHAVRHAYVMQQDVLLPTLTVRETLQYSADLRLPPPSTAADRRRVVDEAILELGLKECADTRIGSSRHGGCSGGEKRRVSIGVQMLANPGVLFLDEPTTGLDATSAFQLVRTLKTLARKGRTVVTTIHQPRSEIWDLFDNLVVLSRGGFPVFSGPADECVPWFAEQGLALPPFVNPAEFVIDNAAVDNRTPELELETGERVDRLKLAWRDESARRFMPLDHKGGGGGGDEDKAQQLRVTELGDSKRISTFSSPSKGGVTHKKEKAGFVRQLRVLTDRTFKVTYRDPLGMAASVLEAVLMGLVTGYLFYDLARDQPGIRSRQGALYTAAGLQGYLFLIFETYRLTVDLPTFDRENSEGCSDALPFLLSRRLARLVTEDFPVPFLYSLILYFMAGFDRSGERFFTFFAIILLNHYIAVTCAMTCVATVRHFPGASLIANLVYTLQSMACGYFIQSNTIPVYMRWLKWITYTYYAFGALCGNEFEHSFYACPYPAGAADPNCAPYTGAYIMRSLGFPTDWVRIPIVVMFAFVVFFCVLSWVGLAFLKVEMTIARARTSDTDLSAGKEKMAARSIAEVRAIDVGLSGFAMTLERRDGWGRRLPDKPILRPVSAAFQAGVLNVIMGPSGSGKTSLLNAMALRLHDGAGTRYRTSGRITFNGAAPSDQVVRSVCSYVCQDDDALLPSLTVRETLRFAAGLRLPSWMTKDDKHRRAEEVLLKMGLKDCADNLVGSDLIKGISGGEKRRVTIAVQILTDPRVLLLDEPTSGLDAFTASSIVEVLRGLATEGRTLVLTIHQARSDLFRHFGNVLLLARGGDPVFAGPARSMLPYFARLGYQCPRHANPADFALDLVTIDLQQEQREAESREKVRALIEAWGGEAAAAEGEKAREGEPRLSGIKEADDEVAEAKGGNVEKEESKDEAILPEKEVEAGAASEPGALIPAPRPSFHKASVATPAELGALVRSRAPFSSAFPILLRRATINFRRQPPLILARIMQVVGFGAVLTLFFAPLRNDYYSVQNRAGFVQEISAFYFVGMLQNVAVYPAERDVFYREDDDGVYAVEAFLATYTALEVPFEVLSCLIFGVMGDVAVGLPRTPVVYFVTVFVCFAVVSCGESIGIMFNTLFGHTGFAVNLISIFLAVANAMAGIMSIDMPALFKAFNYLSPVSYAIRALLPYSLEGVRFTCEADQTRPDGRCLVETGEDVLNLYKLNVNAAVNMGALAATAVVYRLVAWALLRLVRTRWRRRVKRISKDERP